MVTDSLSRAALEGATVSLYRMPGPRFVQAVRSGRNGFVLRAGAAGDYLLIISYLGYQSDSLVLGSADSIPFLRIQLRRSSKALMAVVVTARIPPVIVKNDTIAFNAGAYPTRPNATVEDLLRKLPGIDIDKNGNITMQGQKIDKIYLDGKEFFLNDPRLATQNLPADIVDQIEAFDSQTDRSRLTGVRETTGTKSINIKLKKNRKKGYFGKAYAGIGPPSAAGTGASYSAGGTATNLGSDWLFGTANANNVNNQFTGQDNRNGPGSGLQTLNSAQVDYRSNRDSKLQLTLNAGTSGSRSSSTQSTETKTILTDSALLNNSYSSSTARSRSGQLNAFAEYKIDSLNLLNARLDWSPQWATSSAMDTTAISTQKSAAPFLTNQGQTFNSNTTSGNSYYNQLNFRHRWRKPGRLLLITAAQTAQVQQQPGTIDNRVNNYDSTGALLSQTLTNQIATQRSVANGYVASVTYTEPLSPGHILDGSYRWSTNSSHNDRLAFDFDSATGRYDIPDTVTTSRFVSQTDIQRISAGYDATEGKLRYQLGLTVQFANLEARNLTADSTIREEQKNWYPRASVLYNPGKGRSWNLNYRASTTSPTIQQLQPIPDLTNPFLVRIGNPGLLQQLTHSVDASYTDFNTHNFQNWQANLDADYTEHDITQATTILSGGIQQLQYMNVNGVWHIHSHLTYGFPLGEQRAENASLSLRASDGRDKSLLNGAAETTTTAGLGGTGKINVHPTEKLFLEAEAIIDYTSTIYSLSPAQNTRTLVQTYSIDGSWELPGAWTITSYWNEQITGSQGALPTRAVTQWNGSVFKDCGRKRAVQVRVSVFGILNNTHNLTQTVGLNSLTTQQTSLPGRIVLFSLIYRFRHFPGAGK
jgi:hypothetical protein